MHQEKKSFHLYCSVDIGLNDILYATEGYLPMEHRSCPRENTRLLPFCLDCLTGRSEESQREPDFRSESQNFPLPWG